MVWILLWWVAAMWIRVSYLPYVQVTSDTLSPFVAGVRWWNTGWFQPANPESDQWLWIVSLPLLWVSQSLTQLFWWKCVASTIIVPIAMWLTGQLTDRNRLLWMGVAATVLTLDMGLVDTMVSSFRGYWAPECMSVACVGLFYWNKGKVWGAHLTSIATIVAMGQHPLVLGCIPALIWMWYRMWCRGEAWWTSVLLAGVCLIPRVLWLWQLIQCDAGGLACLTGIAVSSSETLSMWVLIQRVIVDRLWVEMGLASVLMLVGWYHSDHPVLRWWTIATVIGITVLGLSISTLRPYHFRVLIIPMILLALEGLSRMGRWSIALGVLWSMMVVYYRIEPVDWFSTARESDAVAAELCGESDAIWLEGYGSDLQVSPQSVGLSLLLKGCNVHFSEKPTESLWVLQDPNVSASEHSDVVWQNSTVNLHRYSSENWGKMSSDVKWSGHDVAILVWAPEVVQLE
jgi:hypothetical protein